MKRSKYLIAFILCFLGRMPSYADIALRLPELSGIVGDTLTVPVYVEDDLTLTQVLSFQFDIAYSASSMECIGVDTQGTLSATFPQFQLKINGDHLSIVAAGTTPLIGNGVLFYLRFLLKSSSTPIRFHNGSLNNYFNEGTPSLTLTDGYITILNRPTLSIYPASGLWAVGDTPTFSTWGGTPPYTWTVSDPNLAQISQEGELYALKCGTLTVRVKDVNGYSGESEAVQILSYKLSLRDTAYYAGNFVDIPVNLENKNLNQIFAGKFSLGFNPDILHFQQLITTNTLLSGKELIQYNCQSGKLQISFAGAQAVTGSGPLVVLRFKVADATGSTTLSLSEVSINENEEVLSHNAYFSIQDLPPVYIDLPTHEMWSGQQQILTASGGTPPYKWSSTDPNLMDISTQGQVTALSGGVAQVQLTDSLGATNSAEIHIYDTWLHVRDSDAIISGNSLRLAVEIGDLPVGKSIYSLSAIFSCTADFVDSIQTETAETMTSNWMCVSKPTLQNCSFAASNLSGLTQAGTLLYLQLRFNNKLSVGNEAWIHCNQLLLNEGSPNVKVSSGKVLIRETVTSSLHDVANTQEPLIYPTLVTDRLIIPGIKVPATITIYNVQGHRVIQYQNLPEGMDLSTLISGLYFIRIETASKIYHRKFIKR